MSTVILLVIIFGPIIWLARRENERTKLRHPHMFEEPVQVDYRTQIRRNYIHNTRRQLRKEQRHTQQQINQLVSALSQMEKAKL